MYLLFIQYPGFRQNNLDRYTGLNGHHTPRQPLWQHQTVLKRQGQNQIMMMCDGADLYVKN